MRSIHENRFVYLQLPCGSYSRLHNPWIGWVGLVVYVLTQLLLWRTHVDLGLNWSKVLEIREDQEFITHGVFRPIRHPDVCSACSVGYRSGAYA